MFAVLLRAGPVILAAPIASHSQHLRAIASTSKRTKVATFVRHVVRGHELTITHPIIRTNYMQLHRIFIQVICRITAKIVLRKHLGHRLLLA